MERVTLNVERLHLGIADLDALFVSARVQRALDFQAGLVVVAAISSTRATRSASGRRARSGDQAEQAVLIRFDFDVPGGNGGR